VTDKRPGGEHLRSLKEVFQPDPRMEHLVVPTEEGSFRPFSLQDFHSGLEGIRLHEAVPDDIWVHFETARNLVLFSWFVYRFQSVGKLQALASLEFALRERVRREDGPIPKGLRQLLHHAVQKGWVSATSIAAYQEIRQRQHAFVESTSGLSGGRPAIPLLDPNSYLEQLADELPRLRNEFAHGSDMLMGQGARMLRLCADFINQLFEQPETK
jgi:hypothetical protein